MLGSYSQVLTELVRVSLPGPAIVASCRRRPITFKMTIDYTIYIKMTIDYTNYIKMTIHSLGFDCNELKLMFLCKSSILKLRHLRSSTASNNKILRRSPAKASRYPSEIQNHAPAHNELGHYYTVQQWTTFHIKTKRFRNRWQAGFLQQFLNHIINRWVRFGSGQHCICITSHANSYCPSARRAAAIRIGTSNGSALSESNGNPKTVRVL